MKTTEILFFFVFIYPLFMAIFWMMGSLIFFRRLERNERRPPELAVYPKVAILVPCHDEELILRDSIEQLLDNAYPKFEIIAINDGSTDRTGEILAGLARLHPRVRVVTLTRNYGKAMALRAGVLVASAEFLMCIDADALLAKDALFWMIRHFLKGPRVGAVTGNPRVLNRTALLARIQVGEFSTIIGMVKRSQRNVGRIFTVSGVNACYRRAALHDVGYWSPSTVTEDIDISWKLQLKYWDIRYEPRALTWILVPENLRALWRQRVRWAQGGVEAAIRYFHDMRAWTRRRMWSVYVEYWIGVLWCYAFAFTVVCWIGTEISPPDFWPSALAVPTLIPSSTGVILAVACLAQFTVGLFLDGRYERRGLMRHLFWAIWYPAIYWFLNALATVVAVPKGAWQFNKTRYAVWKSPVRRLRDLLVWARLRKRNDQRHYFVDHPIVVHSRRFTELLVTVVFWGVWAYLVAPLVSLVLWFLGIYLFADRMISMGGYRMFADQLMNYGTAVFVMWGLLTLWMLWNRQRYGRHERRTVPPRHITTAQMATTTGLTADTLGSLRCKKEVGLHFETEDRPKIEYAN